MTPRGLYEAGWGGLLLHGGCLCVAVLHGA